jgi:hypothetical protein
VLLLPYLVLVAVVKKVVVRVKVAVEAVLEQLLLPLHQQRAQLLITLLVLEVLEVLAEAVMLPLVVVLHGMLEQVLQVVVE